MGSPIIIHRKYIISIKIIHKKVHFRHLQDAVVNYKIDELTVIEALDLDLAYVYAGENVDLVGAHGDLLLGEEDARLVQTESVRGEVNTERVVLHVRSLDRDVHATLVGQRNGDIACGNRVNR